MQIINPKGIRITDPRAIPVPSYARQAFHSGANCLIMITDSKNLNDLVIAGPTATAVFEYGGRQPRRIHSDLISWYGDATYSNGIVRQDGSWWSKWCSTYDPHARSFQSKDALLRYDTDTEILVYGFHKPGIFVISLRVGDRPGVMTAVMQTLSRLNLDLLNVTSFSTSAEMTHRLVCGASQPIGPDEVRDALAAELEIETSKIDVKGQALTDADLDQAKAMSPLLSVFISYSRKDRTFVFSLYNFLVNAGVKCWLDDHELLPGAKLHNTIRSGVMETDRFLLICSQASLRSWWVDNELEEALAKERSTGDSLVVPIDIDGSIFASPPLTDKCTQIHSRFIGDFTGWEDPELFAKSA